MTTIQIRGFVPESFKGKEFSLRVKDSAEIETFYRNEKIDTGLRYAEGYPIISVRGELASKCQPMDSVLLSVKSVSRSNGTRGIKNVDLQIIPNKKPGVKGSKNSRGVVIARKCDHCGHHEIGIETSAGDYVPLKPGMKVQILGQ